MKALCGSHGGIGVRVPHGRALRHPRMKHQHTEHITVHAQSSGDEGASPQDEKDASALVRESGFSRLPQPWNSPKFCERIDEM